MNREDIIRIAKEAGLEQDGDNFFSSKSNPQVDVHITDLEAFAALVIKNLKPSLQIEFEKMFIKGAAAERERLAKVFDERDKGIGFYDPHEPAEIIRGQT